MANEKRTMGALAGATLQVNRLMLKWFTTLPLVPLLGQPAVVR
jgi:hypothetical protein